MRSADAAATLVDELGASEWAKATGSVPGASFTVSKLRWLAEHEPASAARTVDVLLPHDWLTWRLAGSPTSGATTDRGEASGTGYFSPAESRYRFDLVERALGHEPWLPRIAGVKECCGHTERGVMIAPGTGALPDATGSLHGLTRAAMTPENLARAAVEGMLCGLADGLDALAEQGVQARRVLLIGGAARSQAVRAIAPQLFGVPVVVPDSAEYVAIGAARQAAWMFIDTAEPPAWPVSATTLPPPSSADVVAGQATRLAFAEHRRRLHGV